MGISAVLMIHTIKATSFAWCYADGNKSDEELSVGSFLNISNNEFSFILRSETEKNCQFSIYS